MPNVSTNKDKDAKNSGQGAVGMGGQPSDDPRDLDRGGDGREVSDLGGGTGAVPGAFGSGAGSDSGGGSAGNQTVGPMGDKAATPDVDKAIRSS